MHLIGVLVFCSILSLAQPLTGATWPQVWFSADLAWFQSTIASAPFGPLLDILREAGFMDLGAVFRGMGAEGPLLDFDWGPPVLGAEIAGARSTDRETSASPTEVVAAEGTVLPPTVIVADDFGLDTPTTNGILQAFDEGLISATSLLANMPGFDEAVAAAHDRRLHGAVGVHLNLSEGKSLTDPVRRCPRLAHRDGAFCWTHHFVRKLERDEVYAVATEWRAQIERIVAAGIRPAHLDSHHHTHTSWPFGAIAMAVAREFEIPTIRLSRTFSATPPKPHIKLYKLLYNGRLRRRGFSRMAHFGDVRDVPRALPFARGPIEVMTHPRLAENGDLINHTGGGLLAPFVDQSGLRGAGLSYGALLQLN
jgi:chitin disaccharide deacetylase